MPTRVIAMLAMTSMAACAADTAVITNSGSTNTAGYRIVVERTGKATYTEMRRRGARPDESTTRTSALPDALVRRFFADLAAAQPLSSLPKIGCMKSASFGTTLTVEFDGESSPDLSCGGHDDARMKALIQDSSDILKQFS